MLPVAPPFLPPQAERWVRAGLPRWVTSVVLPGLWLVAVAVAIAGDTTRCTPQDPSVCGPDSRFAFAFVLVLATPVLLWWIPLLGCLAGVAFALADVRYDDIAGARWAFGLHGLLCALVAVRLVRGAAEQRRIARAAAGSAPAGHPITGHPLAPARALIPARHLAPAAGRWLVAGALVLAGIGFFAWYGHAVSTERAHLHRAVRAAGRIVEVRTDDTISVQVRTPSAGTREYRIGVFDYTDPYPLHSSTPVLLDPQDPAWIRLVAEPQDVTYWQSAGIGCFLLALLVLLQGWRWRQDSAALAAGEQPMLRVRIRPDVRGRALILPARSGTEPAVDRPIGRLKVFEAPEPVEDHPPAAADAWEWTYQTQAVFGQAWQDEEPATHERSAPRPGWIEDAVLIGDLRDGGVAMLVTDEVVLLPDGRLRGGPFRSPRSSGQPSRQRLPDRLLAGWQRLTGTGNGPQRKRFTGTAVEAATLRQSMDLPVTLRPWTRTRLSGTVLLLAGLAGFPAAVAGMRPDGLYQFLLLAGLFGQLAAAGGALSLGYLRLDHHRFEIAGRWRTYSIPWDRLYDVRRDGAVLTVAWLPDLVRDVGPFDDPDGERGRQDRAEQVGAMMLLQRQRALLGGLPGRAASSRPGPGWVALIPYAVVVLLTAWWR